ncbi:unnamed protein product [Rotaria sp. Silwood2]|nr:unnamed protein product [Rotaria sp. Silwood2]CAF2478501.1 unnamed protein product [Rotaria sp. Silwood2]CAF2712433.1 unnamed protein product [Rotaria sp. Silwood2]CAF2862843.1 unnamed protein product [Rotaria sp. Silwood2]CAF4259535.1 unnamed protein product [Rotaria sp. Silwood2]
MSIHSKTRTINDHYCQICTYTSSVTGNKRLSCFSCDHCRLSMCYDCFEKHTAQLIDEYSQIQKRYTQLADVFNNKRKLLKTLEEQCVRTVNTAFDEVLNDLQTLRKESIDYIKQQFNESQIVISDMIANVNSLITKSQQNWTRDGITKNVILELDIQRKQINEIQEHLNTFSLPSMQLKMSTYPRNKLDLDCQLLLNLCTTAKKFSCSYPGKIISTKCLCSQHTEYDNEKIDVDTEVEELNENLYSTKEIQTDSIIESNHNTYVDDVIDNDEDEYFSLHEEINNELNNSTHTEHCLSKHFINQGTILTENEVDRIASDGEHLLYFSDTSKSLCYILKILSDQQVNGTSRTKEITCRWPHYPILDLVYSSASSQFVCATKTGVYTCTIDSDNDDSTIDIQLQITQSWSYIRLSADKNFLWLWTDIPHLSQLHVYSAKTFDRIKLFDLNNYSLFSDNSTSFCIHANLIATVFQFKQTTNTMAYKKKFHVTFCDNIDLHELCTINLGECDFDHEIRVNNDGIFFITNGKKKLWIVDRYGKKEYVKLHRTGRALTAHTTNQILIANGTKQLQCIEFVQNDNRNI